MSWITALSIAGGAESKKDNGTKWRVGLIRTHLPQPTMTITDIMKTPMQLYSRACRGISTNRTTTRATQDLSCMRYSITYLCHNSATSLRSLERSTSPPEFDSIVASNFMDWLSYDTTVQVPKCIWNVLFGGTYSIQGWHEGVVLGVKQVHTVELPNNALGTESKFSLLPT